MEGNFSVELSSPVGFTHTDFTQITSEQCLEDRTEN